MRVLLLGGTAEARALAARLHPDVDLISSLAGGCPTPHCPSGRCGSAGSVVSKAVPLVARRADRRCRRRHASLRRHHHGACR
ncbi:precorrin-6x reductase CbiJ/CobK family protein [Mycobacterium xenopi 4042]|uniref:Precorrin-6x reductase CbiJ/CobK family protein n=1 Tax=Mycobacterium xenopi 4042 TaxID=1299334 RepID=X8BG38_MYCXE|nr:precorrin-6x reductase CbiJ/CobK family protein [Mycobacterium xenopi 4042]